VSYRITLIRDAEKSLDRVDAVTRERLRARLRQLAEDPFDRRISKRLREAAGKRSSRVGDWRIIYDVSTEAREVHVYFIEPRGEAYRRIH
jgi:mRNA interferase RelE/StbE